jgi:type IV pilus assembly protein PilP
MNNPAWFKYGHITLMLVVTLCLMACHDPSVTTIHTWMASLREQGKTDALAIDTAAQSLPPPTVSQTTINPFDPANLLRRPNMAAHQASTPFTNRHRAWLESFPISALQFVGVIANSQRKIALIQVDSTVHPLAVGEYLGLNGGQVERISEDTIYYTEWRLSASQQWIKQPGTLTLQEGNDASSY